MKIFLSLLLPTLPLVSAATSEATKPNIIVFYTDDHGYADLGIQGSVPDIRTPNIDALARSGVHAKQGYSTAPQCVPSRAGLLVGKFQGRFQLDHNGESLAGFDRETTIAERLQKSAYATAQFGKWHLGPEPAIPTHGFKHVFAHAGQPSSFANISIDGKDRPMGRMAGEKYHIDGCSQAAAAIVERYKNDPFFLYIAFRAPHTPLDAPRSYTDRFPGDMPERRRQALAMLSAVDDGVGLITATLKKLGLTDKTLVFLIGDNGAPLKIHKQDAPLNSDPGGWDGSLNTPLNGEKGMLAEGGIRVPFVIAWPGTIPSGQSYEYPVTALDVAATAAAMAGIQTQPGDLDGVNLIPHLKGLTNAPPHDSLYWRWVAQSAIREGNWKLLRGGEREYLYDLATDREEKHNLASKHPETAARLREKLTVWGAGLNPPGLTLGPMAATWNNYFDHYLDGKPHTGAPATADKKGKRTATDIKGQPWQARNGTLNVKDGVLELVPEKGPKPKSPFLTRSQLHRSPPSIVRFDLKATTSGAGRIAWRSAGQKDFTPANLVTFTIATTADWKTHEIKIPASDTMTHLRIHFTDGTSLVRDIEIIPDSK